jgi:tetratricopeptide (TPR) repeat protein
MSEEQGPQTEQEIYDALGRLQEAPYGTARSARTEELVEAAERLELAEALPVAMLELLNAYEFGNELRKTPVVFGRILKLYEEKPESFDDWSVHRLFWCFKWVTSSLVSLPEIALPVLEGWTVKMREHYVAAGKPLQAVHTSRFHLASHTGIGQEPAYELWATRPRDEFSDCEACEARARGVYWQDRGDDERALREWEPVLGRGLECGEEPASTISHALLSLVRTGRGEEAASLHRSGYRMAKTEVNMDVQVGRHLEFLALTGNAARGLELLAENRSRFDSGGAPLKHLRFLDGVRVLLTRLVAEGAAQAPVTGPGGRTYTVESLLGEITALTDDLARTFDERNGTSNQGDFHRRRCAQTPLTAEPLPLGLRVVPIAAATDATPVTADAVRTPLPQDFPALLAEAREALRLGRPDNDALWMAVAEQAGEADLDELLRADLADREAARRAKEQEWTESAALDRRAAELYDAANEPGRAAARRSRAVWCAFMESEDPASLPWEEFDALLATVEALRSEDRIEPEEYLIVRHSRAVCALIVLMSSVDEPAADEARARFSAENEALLEAAAELEVFGRAASAEALRADVLLNQGRAEQGLSAFESAISLAERAERPWSLPRYLAQQGRLLNRMGRLDEAVPVLHRALALLGEWPDPQLDDAGVLMELARNRLHAEDLGAAITHLTSAASKFDRQGRAVAAADARALLGQALLRGGRRADWIAVLESLLGEEAEAQLAEEQRAQLRLDLGRALMQSDEPLPAAEIFARLADFVADWPDGAVLTLVAGELVCALYSARRWDEGEKAVERALAVHETAPNPAMVCRMLRVAAEAEFTARAGVERALDLLLRSDEVNEAAEEIEDRYRRWPETALNADLRAQALVTAARPEQALAACEAAIAAWAVGGDPVVGNYAESVLTAASIEGEKLGRGEQAVARLTAALERCREAGHDRAVQVLTARAEAFEKGK